MLPADVAPSESPEPPLARVRDWCFRDPSTGKLAIIQMPNLSLAVFVVLSVARSIVHPHGAAGTAVSVVAGAALIGWAIDEIVRGNSRFRRALGAVVLIAFAISLIIN